jgi:hypothetical protein
MREYKLVNIKYSYPVLLFAIAAIVFICLTIAATQLWFFDEDVFVTNANNSFMKSSLQRIFLVKQFYKVQLFLFGNKPVGYHIVSALLHILNGLVATAIFRLLCTQYKVIEPKNIIPVSLCFFVLFLVSPIHSEPLCYILAQDALFCSLFCLLSIYFFLKSTSIKSAYFILSVVMFIPALLSYEVSWILPAIIVLLAVNQMSRHKSFTWHGLASLIPFFLVFAAWHTIRYLFISKVLVTEYSGITFTNINFINLAKNYSTLFIRNFLPPFEDVRVTFVWTTVVAAVIVFVLLRAFKLSKAGFYFSAVLLIITLLAVSPVSLFGIDSHDSESERYIYFSSSFALMFLSFSICSFINHFRLISVICSTIFILYVYTLLNAVNIYIAGGSFSKKYTALLATIPAVIHKVYLINQPAQFKGALLLRALSRLPSLGTEQHTVVNEHLHYLHQKNYVEYYTISHKQFKYLPTSLTYFEKPMDSLANFVGTLELLPALPFLKESKSAVVVLKHDSLIVYR